MSNFKLRLNTDISGNSDQDLIDAIDEIVRLLKNGYTSGLNSNDDGKFSFEIVDTKSLQDQINTGAETALADENLEDDAFLRRVDAAVSDHDGAEIALAEINPTDDAIVEAAIDLFYKDGDLEIDPGAECAHGDDNGCYVQAWKWFDFSGTKWDKKKSAALIEQEFADRLNGRRMGDEITVSEEREAGEAGLLVIFGASDDCVEFRGARNEEFYASAVVLNNPLVRLKPVGPKGPQWTFETEAPHGKFNIMEGEEIFCRGIVVRIS